MTLLELIKGKFLVSFFLVAATGAGEKQNGTFDNSNAYRLLSRASQSLADDLRSKKSAELELPVAWSSEAFIQLVEKIETESRENERGIDRTGTSDLKEFSYVGNRPENAKIVALQPFFTKYAWVPAEGTSDFTKDIVKDLQLKILCEAGHIIWNYNEVQAENYARRTLNNLSSLRFSENESPTEFKQTNHQAIKREVVFKCKGDDLNISGEVVAGNWQFYNDDDSSQASDISESVKGIINLYIPSLKKSLILDLKNSSHASFSVTVDYGDTRISDFIRAGQLEPEALILAKSVIQAEGLKNSKIKMRLSFKFPGVSLDQKGEFSSLNIDLLNGTASVGKQAHLQCVATDRLTYWHHPNVLRFGSKPVLVIKETRLGELSSIE